METSFLCLTALEALTLVDFIRLFVNDNSKKYFDSLIEISLAIKFSIDKEGASALEIEVTEEELSMMIKLFGFDESDEKLNTFNTDQTLLSVSSKITNLRKEIRKTKIKTHLLSFMQQKKQSASQIF